MSPVTVAPAPGGMTSSPTPEGMTSSPTSDGLELPDAVRVHIGPLLSVVGDFSPDRWEKTLCEREGEVKCQARRVGKVRYLRVEFMFPAFSLTKDELYEATSNMHDPANAAFHDMIESVEMLRDETRGNVRDSVVCINGKMPAWAKCLGLGGSKLVTRLVTQRDFPAPGDYAVTWLSWDVVKDAPAVKGKLLRVMTITAGADGIPVWTMFGDETEEPASISDWLVGKLMTSTVLPLVKKDAAAYRKKNPAAKK